MNPVTEKDRSGDNAKLEEAVLQSQSQPARRLPIGFVNYLHLRA
jgi:hypothetical protein